MRRRTPAPKPASLALAIFFACSLSSATSPAGPLIVTPDSHIVVMQYEAWFGPNAVTFQGTAAMPLLQSADMQTVGGGYDSADPMVIRQHVAWMEYMGIDAAISDLTNNVSCIFNTLWFAKKYLPYCTSAFRSSMQTIRDNTGNLYPSWTRLGTDLKLIPLLGGADETELYKDLDGKTAFEKEVDYFGALMQQYPGRQVIYEGKPLMLVFLGAAQDPIRSDHPLWLQIRSFLTSHPEIGEKYTFRMIAGYLDSQPYLWLNPGMAYGPEEINPGYNFWSWVDRFKISCAQPYCPYYPTFNEISDNAGSRVENMTASIATAGQYGWGCPNSNAVPYCPDAALRFGADGTYETLSSFITYANQLEPMFLIIHQFNEFVPPDEGFDANTDDDVEPANLWGFSALEAVKRQIAIYRQGQ